MNFLLFLYLANAVLLAVAGIQNLILTWIVYKSDKILESEPSQSVSDFSLANEPWERNSFPPVTVQLPVYNERHVVRRLLRAVAALDWPQDKLQIQILDDSTDDTTEQIESEIALLKHKQVKIEHIRRSVRTDYKAGALRDGMKLVSGEYIAIFDADFLPSPDFLQRTIPLFFKDEQVGCVQTRWGHINRDESLLTRGIALGIDGHFWIEQTARSRIDAFLNFNGTAGVWRAACIQDAGGWRARTLTEDLDLSYRAQLKGWKILYDNQHVVPAELPLQLDAFKSQQFRWAKGSIQTAKMLIADVWRAPIKLWQKVLASVHLLNYAVHPMLLLNLILTIPMLITKESLWLVSPFLLLGAIGPPTMYLFAAHRQGFSLQRSLRDLAVLVPIGIGLSINNTRAVIEALNGTSGEFHRTPKFASPKGSKAWQESGYTLPRHPIAWMEILFMMLAIFLLGWAIQAGIWGLTPWLLLYSVSYGIVAGISFWQSYQIESGSKRTKPELSESKI